MAPAPGSAQIAWDAPPLVSHVAPSGFSVFLVSPEGGELGGLATFRHAAGPVGLGYRFPLADESGTDNIAVSGGVDVSGFLARAVEGSEVEVVWWSGRASVWTVRPWSRSRWARSSDGAAKETGRC